MQNFKFISEKIVKKQFIYKKGFHFNNPNSTYLIDFIMFNQTIKILKTILPEH